MKYKRIQGVAHNLGHSFLSDSNAVMRDGVYTIVPFVLFKAARTAAVPRVDIDLVNETIEPVELSLPELKQSVAFYRTWLPQLLQSHGVEPSVIRAATIAIVFDYSRDRHTQYAPAESIPEFVCTVSL